MKKYVSALAILGIIAGTFFVQSSFVNAESRITGLGDLPGGDFESRAEAINTQGQVVGQSLSLNGPQAFIWDAENGIKGLGDLEGGAFYSHAYGINDSGQAVGISKSLRNQNGEAFIWDTVNGMKSLVTLSSGFSEAQAINNVGQVVGRFSTEHGIIPFIWDAQNGLQRIGNSVGVAQAINDKGQVVGWYTSENGFEAFIWDPIHGLIGLGDLPGGSFLSNATDINEQGQVTGTAWGENGGEAFIWDPINGMRGIGDLPGGEFYSTGQSINELGEIVGWSRAAYDGPDGHPFIDKAFIWDEQNGMRAQEGFVESDVLNWNMAFDINDGGNVVGRFNTENGLEAFIAEDISPTPTPSPTPEPTETPTPTPSPEPTTTPTPTPNQSTNNGGGGGSNGGGGGGGGGGEDPQPVSVRKGQVKGATTIACTRPKDSKVKDFIQNRAVPPIVERLFGRVFGKKTTLVESTYWKGRARCDKATESKLFGAMLLQKSRGSTVPTSAKSGQVVKPGTRKDAIRNADIPAVVEREFTKVFGRKPTKTESSYWKSRARSDKKTIGSLSGAMLFQKTK